MLKKHLSRRRLHSMQREQEFTIEQLETILVSFLNMPWYQRWCWMLTGWIPASRSEAKADRRFMEAGR